MAHFDFIMRVSAPDDESVSAFAMAVRRTGNVSAKVTRAFTPEEWGKIVIAFRSSPKSHRTEQLLLHRRFWRPGFRAGLALPAG